jgi:PAS domain S-box-containing protein
MPSVPVVPLISGLILGVSLCLTVPLLLRLRSKASTKEATTTKPAAPFAWAEALPMAVFLLSKSLSLVYANSTCKRLFSNFTFKDEEKIRTGEIPEWIHPKDGRNLFEIWNTLKGLTHGAVETRVRIRGENGDWIWIQLKLTAVVDDTTTDPNLADNEPSSGFKILGTCEDITVFQTAIHALRDRESRTKRLLSGVKDAAILILCEDGYIQFCNDAAQSVLGFTEAELVGQHVSLLSPRPELISGQLLNTLAQADSNLHHEEITRRIRKCGNGFWASVLTTALTAEIPYSKNYCMVIRDVSHYKREEKELHEWKKRFEQLSENVKEAFWIYDVRAASMVYISPVFQPLLNISPEAGDSFFSEVLRKVHPSDLILARNFMSDLTLGQDASVEFRVLSHSDDEQWLSFKSFAVRDSSNRTHRIVGVAEDVTEGKTAQIALRNAKEEADAANKAKSEFLANMSHEIRTPLGAIMGFAELMGDFQNSEEERLLALQAILRNGRQLTKIIDEILDLSKVEAGKLEIEEEEIELLGFIEDVTTLLSLQAREKGIALQIEPRGILPVKITTDGTKLRQILINIIGNAVKFTSRGSVTIELSVALDAKQSMLHITVTDTGPGLDENQSGRIFQPFVQADSSTRKRFGGTGLGLVLSRRLAKLLGGDISLRWSRPGSGSCFAISLAIGPAHNLKLSETTKTSRKNIAGFDAKSPLTRLEGKSILVVDDAADNRLIVQRFLSHAGAQVEHAEDGRTGARMALERNYDLIVMDIQMPEFDGYQTIEFLRRNGFNKPVIALSAHAMREDRERSLASGFSEHLCKPVNRRELLARIATLLKPVSSFSPNYEMQ